MVETDWNGKPHTSRRLEHHRDLEPIFDAEITAATSGRRRQSSQPQPVSQSVCDDVDPVMRITMIDIVNSAVSFSFDVSCTNETKTQSHQLESRLSQRLRSTNYAGGRLFSAIAAAAICSCCF